MLHLSRFLIPALIILIIPFVSAGEVGVHYVIDLKENGSAAISEEHRISLVSPGSESDFKNYSYNTEKIRDDFRKEWDEIVSIAEDYLGRDLSVQNFDVAVFKAGIGDYGLVKFSFECSGFAEATNGEMLVGDIFLGGSHLHENDTLTIRYPEGYSVDSISPEPDKSSTNEVVWHGIRDFSSGEPGILLRTEPSYVWIWAVAAIFVIIGSFFGLTKKRRTSQPEGTVTAEDSEDKIVQLLESAGGSMLQSEIVKLTGFSKSKTSTILSEMKEEGKIQKVKKGRENLIRLL